MTRVQLFNTVPCIYSSIYILHEPGNDSWVLSWAFGKTPTQQQQAGPSLLIAFEQPYLSSLSLRKPSLVPPAVEAPQPALPPPSCCLHRVGAPSHFVHHSSLFARRQKVSEISFGTAGNVSGLLFAGRPCMNKRTHARTHTITRRQWARHFVEGKR